MRFYLLLVESFRQVANFHHKVQCAGFCFAMYCILLWNINVPHRFSVQLSNIEADFPLNLKLWWKKCRYTLNTFNLYEKLGVNSVFETNTAARHFLSHHIHMHVFSADAFFFAKCFCCPLSIIPKLPKTSHPSKTFFSFALNAVGLTMLRLPPAYLFVSGALWTVSHCL